MSKDCGYWFIITTMKFSGDHVASQTVALSIWDMKQIQRSVPNSAPKVTPARSSLHVLITSGTMWGDSNKTRKMSLWIICLSCLRLLDCIFLSKGWDLHAGKTVFYRMPRLGASLRSASSLIPHHLSTTILFLIMMPLTRFKQVETGSKWRCGIIKRHLLEMKIAQKRSQALCEPYDCIKDVTTWGWEQSWFAIDCILLLFTFYTASRVLWNPCCNKNLTMANLSALSRQTEFVSHQRTSQKIGPICWRQSYFCGLTELVLSVLLFRGTLHFQREWVQGREREGDTRRRRDESERDERGRNKQPEKERKVRELSQTDTKAVTRKALNTHSLNFYTYSSLQLILN